MFFVKIFRKNAKKVSKMINKLLNCKKILFFEYEKVDKKNKNCNNGKHSSNKDKDCNCKRKVSAQKTTKNNKK